MRVERQPGGEVQQTAAVERLKAAVLQVDPQASFERIEVVGPKVSGELAKAGVIAVILATLAMLVYIWVRFKWPFAVGAILTLVMDFVLTLGVFALTGLDFNLTASAALLTLVGYSVNDEVVVYDPVRENLRSLRKRSRHAVIDLYINQTLTRSLYTSVTAFLAVLPLAIWGGTAVACCGAYGRRHRHRGVLVGLHSCAHPAVPGGLASASRATMFAAEATDPSAQASTRPGLADAA